MRVSLSSKPRCAASSLIGSPLASTSKYSSSSERGCLGAVSQEKSALLPQLRHRYPGPSRSHWVADAPALVAAPRAPLFGALTVRPRHANTDACLPLLPQAHHPRRGAPVAAAQEGRKHARARRTPATRDRPYPTLNITLTPARALPGVVTDAVVALTGRTPPQRPRAAARAAAVAPAATVSPRDACSDAQPRMARRRGRT